MSSEAAGPGPAPSRLVRWAVTFGRFWWDFLVGDTPELLVGTVAALVVAGLVAHGSSRSGVEVAILPVLVAALLGWSVWRVHRRTR